MNNGPFCSFLNFVGRNGPMMLLSGVFVGLVAPSLADAARPLLGTSVFIFTLGAFLKVDQRSFQTEASDSMLAGLAFFWAILGVPALIFGIIKLTPAAPDLGQAIVLSTLSPPVTSAAAIAAMMDLSVPFALLISILATITAPIVVPALVASMTGAHLVIDPVAMAEHLLLIVGGAGLAAGLIRQYAGRFVQENPQAVTGVAVAGLILLAIGMMHGMDTVLLAHPRRVIGYCALAFALNAGLQCLGSLVFFRFGRRICLTIGLISGNRNVALMWVSLGSGLVDNPDVETYLAMAIFPIFILPAASSRAVKWIMRDYADPGFCQTSRKRV